MRNKGCTRRSPPHGLLIFMDRDVLDMTLIERMVAAGMSRECAAETAMWFMAQGDDEGLERYVLEVESKKKWGAISNGVS